MFAVNSPEFNNPPRPKLFVILFSTKTKINGDTSVYQWIGVANDNREAAMIALDSMRKNIPDLWNLGMNNGGFKVILENSFTRENIESIFNAKERQNTPLIKEIKVVEDNPDTPKNLLIKKLIGEADYTKLEQEKENLTDAEYKYIKAQIKYAQNANRR